MLLPAATLQRSLSWKRQKSSWEHWLVSLIAVVVGEKEKRGWMAVEEEERQDWMSGYRSETRPRE